MLTALALAILAQLPGTNGEWDSPIISSCPLIDANCESRPVTTTRASSAWWQHTDGGVSVADAGIGRYDRERGLLSYAGEANAVPGLFSAWIAESQAQSQGGNPGAPTVGAVGTCPDPMGGLSGVKVDFPAVTDTSTDGGMVGYSVLYKSFTGTAAPWIDDVYLRAYDISDGGTLYSGIVGLTSAACSAGAAWSRCSSAGTLSAATRYMLIGPDARLAQGQPTAQPALSVCLWAPVAKLGSVAGPPGPVCGASPCSTASDVSLMPAAGLPIRQGKVTQTYRPMHTVAVARCFLDTIASNNGLRLCTAADDTLVLTLGNGSATATTTSAAQTWTGGTDYRLEVEWGGGNAWVRKDGAVVASTVNGSQKVPTAHAANIAIGNLIAGTSPAQGFVSKPQWGYR